MLRSSIYYGDSVGSKASAAKHRAQSKIKLSRRIKKIALEAEYSKEVVNNDDQQ